MTQGLMYGFSSGLLFAPCISFVDEWFYQRRGLANGILYVSSGEDDPPRRSKSTFLTSKASDLQILPQLHSRPYLHGF